MSKEHRLDQIISIVEERRYVSVVELSQLLDVSEMTIRRDLALLDEEKRLRRTYGGASSLRYLPSRPAGDASIEPEKSEFIQVDQVDVLIATSVNPYYDKLLLDRVEKKNIPIIAESLAMPNQRTVVSLDNYKAALDLGRAVGEYLIKSGLSQANVLDLTFQLANTQKRSQGFLTGIRESCPNSEMVLSINSQSRASVAYQITSDALTVHPHINVIFAINDSTALGAIRACKDLHIDPRQMIVVTFGLEGDTLRDILMQNSYCKLGLAMFPEIVALACVDAAIRAYEGNSLSERYITPHVVLTSETLPDYYQHTPQGWRLNWDAVRANLPLPSGLAAGPRFNKSDLPVNLGLIVPFSEHEWYKELIHYLNEYANQCGANLHIIDAEQNVQDEVELRRQAIARKAASLVETGDVILVDGGPIASYLAEELRTRSGITVITNSIEVMDTLNHCPGITLISTGGVLRYSSQMLVGPTAESALKELRADKLFLMVGGISLDFGLSHTNISEVSIKQAMIRSAREVILPADHTIFTAESTVQVAPLSVVKVLITDNALAPSIRLNLTKLGIRLLLA